MSTAISVEHVTKAYRLGTIGSSTVSADLSRWWARLRGKPDPFLKVGRERQARRSGELFWALDDVSFDIQRGGVVGIIGRNGAGKSTLLKILSRVTAPTSGQITVRGRIASLLEVGTGFNPELTGRENVFLNGAILGMTKPEIRSKFDEIVAFSECEEFIDTPVKRYSSGMYVRLAFAVAAHLEPEILIVDEVLAVGDAQFQKKCLGKMRDVSQHGRTILFVSHSMAAVSALCDRAILLDGGRVILDGETSQVVAGYHAAREKPARDANNLLDMTRQGTGKGRFASVQVTPVDAIGHTLPFGRPGCDVMIETTIHAIADFSGANVAVVVFDANGVRVIDVNTALHGDFLSLTAGQQAVARFRLHEVLLKPGRYSINLWLGRGGVENMDHVEDAVAYHVEEDSMSIKHTETFPGIYQCRFTEHMVVGAPKTPSGLELPTGRGVASKMISAGALNS